MLHEVCRNRSVICVFIFTTLSFLYQGDTFKYQFFFISHSTIDSYGAQLPNTNHMPDQMLSDLVIPETEILDLLKSIDTSKATGPDGISPRMLKEAATVIYPSFTRIINLSLSFCQVPKEWKKAHVLPIHKKKAKNVLDNYRPVSL